MRTLHSWMPDREWFLLAILPRVGEDGAVQVHFELAGAPISQALCTRGGDDEEGEGESIAPLAEY